MKYMRTGFLVVFLGIMGIASLSLPRRGDPEAAGNQAYSPAGSPSAAAYYLENAYKETHTDNTVTAVLADYRAFDTLGETLVVFVAGVACVLLLGKGKDKA